MFRFAYSYYLYGLLLIPVLFILFMLVMHSKKKALARYGEMSIIRILIPDISRGRQYIKFILLLIALAFLILALARPQMGSKLEKGERKGIDLIICLDVSNSMLAQDIKPSRIERAKNAVTKMIDELKNDRIGIVIFAGKAYVQLPVTTDYAAAKLFLSTISTDMVPVQGTAIGAAIDLAVKSFEETKHSKAIILITDGENHEDDAIRAAKEAASKGIKIYTVGMGLPDGAPIPIMQGTAVVGFKKDEAGNTVVTKLDDLALQQIAAAGEGAYVRASNTQSSLNKIYDEINKLQKSEFEAKVFSDFEDQYQYPLGTSLFFLIFEILILERRNKWLSRIKLFG